jgi:hypothetical protein
VAKAPGGSKVVFLTPILTFLSHILPALEPESSLHSSLLRPDSQSAIWFGHLALLNISNVLTHLQLTLAGIVWGSYSCTCLADIINCFTQNIHSLLLPYLKNYDFACIYDVCDLKLNTHLPNSFTLWIDSSGQENINKVF